MRYTASRGAAKDSARGAYPEQNGWGDDDRYQQYWRQVPGCYAAGDIAVGASVTGAVEVVLPEHLGSYRLVLTAPALGTSGVDL